MICNIFHKYSGKRSQDPSKSPRIFWY